MGREGIPCADGGGGGGEVPSFLLEVLAGLDSGASQMMAEVIGLYREFPSWAVWLPSAGRSWTAVRPASGRAPGPELPMAWVHAGTAAQLADRMRRVEEQLDAW
jgi:hypothetical protein